MRVALFTETFLPKMDGIVRVMCLLVDHLHKRGIETLLVVPQLGQEPLRDYNGSKVISLNGIPIPFYPENRITAPSLTVYRELQRFQPDIVHVLHPVTTGLPGFFMAKQLGYPTLISFHLDFARLVEHLRYGFIPLGFMSPMIDFATRMVFNQADYTLAPSKAIQQQMQKMGIARVGLWKRGVDAERFHPRHKSAQMRQHLSQGHPDDTLLIYVGRLSQEKQVHLLRDVLERVPHTRLALIGDGPYRTELEKIFKGTKTFFTGYMLGEALLQAYASADMFVFPSALETFGLVVTEAMAAGLPVVASCVGGIPDVVQEGVTGYTFDIGDLEGFIAGVVRLSADREQMAQMGQSARAYAETQTWEHMMDEVIELYAQIIAERQAIHPK